MSSVNGVDGSAVDGSVLGAGSSVGARGGGKARAAKSKAATGPVMPKSAGSKGTAKGKGKGKGALGFFPPAGAAPEQEEGAGREAAPPAGASGPLLARVRP